IPFRFFPSAVRKDGKKRFCGNGKYRLSTDVGGMTKRQNEEPVRFFLRKNGRKTMPKEPKGLKGVKGVPAPDSLVRHLH
ncbi:hypothetical protein, partial [uncultured Bacteroides sp.]|uniref:hypothetical protein n=1 Tax=uncultured Bacteroides sp. TaxID=162156 RepID=UPI00261C341E